MIAILAAMRNLWQSGNEEQPRGLKTIETLNYQFQVDYPFSSFAARKFDMGYLKQEFLWYLAADPKNTSILQASKNWNKFRQPSGDWFSCYGQYWFGPHTREGLSGLEWVVGQLSRDRDSRQAIIPMLQPRHLFDTNPDIVCTSYVNFHIRNGYLNMTVRMRSSDIIWGYGNDLPCFWWLWEMVAISLGVQRGVYTHSSDSLHVYERHFNMIEEIVRNGMDGFYHVEYPKITDPEDLLYGSQQSDFGRWLNEF